MFLPSKLHKKLSSPRTSSIFMPEGTSDLPKHRSSRSVRPSFSPYHRQKKKAKEDLFRIHRVRIPRIAQNVSEDILQHIKSRVARQTSIYTRSPYFTSNFFKYIQLTFLLLLLIYTYNFIILLKIHILLFGECLRSFLMLSSRKSTE